MGMANHKTCKHFDVCDYRNDIGRCPDRCIQYKHEDAVIVIRCKECVNYQETVGKDSGKPCGYGSCINPCAMIGIVYDEDFCSYGERRTDAN